MQAGRFSKAVLAAAVAAALGTSGCSDDDAKPSEPRHPVAAAVGELRDAFEADDTAAICERMTRPAQRQAARIAQTAPTTCPRDVARAFEAIADGGGWGEGEKPVVTDIERFGPRAAATIEDEDGWKADVALAREGGAWKLASFVGVPPPDFEAIEENMRSRPSPAATAAAVAAVDGAGKPCPDLSDFNHPEVTGGCSFTVVADSVPVRVLTPFGDFKLADCSLGYRVSVAPQGHSWTEQLALDGEGQDRRDCSDVRQCFADATRRRPWKGRFLRQRGEDYLHQVDICLRTPVGFFVGDFVMRLVRRGDGWRLQPTDRGATGFRLDGELAVTGEPFELHDRFGGPLTHPPSRLPPRLRG